MPQLDRISADRVHPPVLPPLVQVRIPRVLVHHNPPAAQPHLIPQLLRLLAERIEQILPHRAHPLPQFPAHKPHAPLPAHQIVDLILRVVKPLPGHLFPWHPVKLEILLIRQRAVQIVIIDRELRLPLPQLGVQRIPPGHRQPVLRRLPLQHLIEPLGEHAVRIALHQPFAAGDLCPVIDRRPHPHRMPPVQHDQPLVFLQRRLRPVTIQNRDHFHVPALFQQVVDRLL